MENFRVMFVGSLALAILTFATPWLASVKTALFLAGLWGAVVLLALFGFRKRGLWFLVGTPLALYWPVVVVVLCQDFRAFC
jgi:hypothetical protein